MEKKLKILFIPRWYPSRVDVLKGIFVKRHALAVGLKHEVSVLFVCADPEMKDKTYDPVFSVEDGINTTRIYYNNSLLFIPFITSLVKFYRYLKSCYIGIKIMNEKTEKPDISHIHVLTRTFFPAYYYKLFYTIPYIITEQWSGYLPEDGAYKGFLKKIVTKIAVRKASAVTTVSESLKNAMIFHGLQNEYTIIPNVVDVNLFFPAFQKNTTGKSYLLTVADMDDRAKNISGTLNVIEQLSQTRMDFEYHIIGDGADRHALETLAANKEILNKYVFFHGAKKSSEVADMMRIADLFILFSNYDNMPCVMIESFASALPVIGSEIHGMKEHIKQGLGILVPPGNESELYNAIQTAMEHPALFDKKHMRQYALDHFSYDAVGKMFDTVYKKAI